MRYGREGASCQSEGVYLLQENLRENAALAKTPPQTSQEAGVHGARNRGEGCDGEGPQPPQSGKQTPQQGDWPGCGDPQFQDRLFVLQSSVCLITGFELNEF